MSTGIEKIAKKHNDELGGVIAMLEEIQAKYSYLPEEALKTVAEETGRSLVDIYGGHVLSILQPEAQGRTPGIRLFGNCLPCPPGTCNLKGI
jgi:hypothetical protein